jgi:hypothetical protein
MCVTYNLYIDGVLVEASTDATEFATLAHRKLHLLPEASTMREILDEARNLIDGGSDIQPFMITRRVGSQREPHSVRVSVDIDPDKLMDIIDEFIQPSGDDDIPEEYFKARYSRYDT